MGDATGASDLMGSVKMFRDPFNTIMPRFSCEIIPKNRFTCNRSSVFVHEVCKSFIELIGTVQRLIAGKFAGNSIEHIGNVGTGKSHNVAAALVYLREVFKLQS